MSEERKNLWRLSLGALAVLFGVMTLIEGGHVIFGGPEAQREAGEIVWFVLIFTFGAGFFYVLGGVGALLQRGWSVWVARALAVSTLAVFVAFDVHVMTGGAYMTRTVLAMTFRAGFWVLQAMMLPRVIGAMNKK